MKRISVWSILFLALVLLFLYLPIFTVVLYSFNSNDARVPIEFTGFTARWYDQLFTGAGHYGDALLVSVRVALLSVALSTAIGTLGAIGMAQRERAAKPGKAATALEWLVMLPIMIPDVILGVAFLGIFLAVGIPKNEIALVLSHTTFCIPYLYLTVKSRLVGMDQAVFDAARDLGASPRRVLLDITLPLCRPAILSGAFLALAMSLDDFVISFFVSDTAVTLPVKVYSAVKLGISPQINALCTVMIAAVFTAVAVSQYAAAVRRRRQSRAQTQAL